MGPDHKSPDSHVAYEAAIDGFAKATANFAVVGRYWWNLQMQFLIVTGAMPFFRMHWWLFLVAGFLLLAFLMPIGVALAISAFCAGGMNPVAEENYIVPLKYQNDKTIVPQEKETEEFDEALEQDNQIDDVLLASAIHHLAYVKKLDAALEDRAFAAAALGAFNGTLLAFDLRLSDIEIHTMGAAFVARQISESGRMQTHDAEWLSEVTVEAMSSSSLSEIRTEASQIAYQMEKSLQQALGTRQ